MSTLCKEVNIIQNPALGSIILWWFVKNYTENNSHNEPVPLPLLFIVLPIVYHEDFHELIHSTQKRSGLRTMAEKFSKSDISKVDVLFTLQERALLTRELVLDSLHIAISSKLLLLNPDKAVVYSLQGTLPKLPKSIQEILTDVMKLAIWCSNLTLYEISLILKVRF